MLYRQDEGYAQLETAMHPLSAEPPLEWLFLKIFHFMLSNVSPPQNLFRLDAFDWAHLTIPFAG